MKEEFNDIHRIRVTDFDDASAAKFSDEFLKLYNKGHRLIPVYINSYGGQVHALLEMVELIDAYDDVVVPTIATGKAMSCGAFLLAFGTKGYRYVGSLTDVMMHEVASMFSGKMEDLENRIKLTRSLQQRLIKKLNKVSKQNWNKLLLKNNRTDMFLSPHQTLSYGLADYVGQPKFSFEKKEYETISLI